ncbi:MAG: CDP-alcohol phosphatidyltransferase family protein [Thermoleophilia bacterium]|jgi:cardiolipin synthase
MRYLRQIPNTLTVLRLLSLPAFVVLYAHDAPRASWSAATLLFFAALSDVADGFIARRFHFESDFGRILDPFVDRAFYVTLLVTLLVCGTLPWWAVAPIVIRDAVMVGGAAALLRLRGERPRVMVKGKISNLVLVCGIEFFIIDLRTVAWVVFGFGAALYLYAGGAYVVRARKEYGQVRAAQS